MSLMPSLSLMPTVASNPSLVVLMPIIGIFAVPRRLTSSGLMPNEETNNVLKGDMSLVGPRPALPDEVARYGSLYSTRLLVKPGITGP